MLSFFKRILNLLDLGTDDEEEISTDRPNNVVSLKNHSGREQPSITLMVPSSFEDSKDIADQLKNGVIVVVNLSKVEPHTAKRIIDFGAGVICGLKGEILKADEKVYIFANQGVSLCEYNHNGY